METYKIKKFCPVLFSNESVSLEEIPQKDYAISRKFDGIRMIFKNTDMLSRSLKQIQNIQLRKKFENISKWASDNKIILDGEAYDHNLPLKNLELDDDGFEVLVDRFQQISSLVMTQDFECEKTFKKLTKRRSYLLKFYEGEGFEKFNNPLEFYCFDTFTPNNPNEPFLSRLHKIPNIPNLVVVSQMIISNKQDIKELMKSVLNDGYEGLMLRDPNSKYKFGRITSTSGDGYKLKNYQTFDAKIIDIVQATKVNPNAEKKINELGYSETSKKKDDRIPIEMIAGFWVEYNGVKQKVVYAETEEVKKKMWNKRDSLIGKWIEFKGMLEGSKDKVRHPVWIRFREDKE